MCNFIGLFLINACIVAKMVAQPRNNVWGNVSINGSHGDMQYRKVCVHWIHSTEAKGWNSSKWRNELNRTVYKFRSNNGKKCCCIKNRSSIANQFHIDINCKLIVFKWMKYTNKSVGYLYNFIIIEFGPVEFVFFFLFPFLLLLISE